MSYDAYLLLGNGRQMEADPVFRLSDSDHHLLVTAMRRSGTSLPLLQRLGDFYRDALIAGSEADSLRREFDVVCRIEPALVQKLATLRQAVEIAQTQGMNLHFVAD